MTEQELIELLENTTLPNTPPKDLNYKFMTEHYLHYTLSIGFGDCIGSISNTRAKYYVGPYMYPVANLMLMYWTKSLNSSSSNKYITVVDAHLSYHPKRGYRAGPYITKDELIPLLLKSFNYLAATYQMINDLH